MNRMLIDGTQDKHNTKGKTKREREREGFVGRGELKGGDREGFPCFFFFFSLSQVGKAAWRCI